MNKVVAERDAKIERPAGFAMPETFLKLDSRAVPSSLLETSTRDLGNDVLPKDSVTSAEFHQREVKYLWKKIWQLACRENEIPNVGDRIAYDVVGQSVMVVRTGPDTIKAYHNTCRHRGTRLLADCDHVQQITCPFHSWSWTLDGQVKTIPARWDFPGVSDAELALREVRCERWNSFVYINFDNEASSLEAHLGPDLVRHWKDWPRDRERKIYHYGKIIPCNWKLALHAFNEIYHTVGTHPETLVQAADCATQYDFFGPHSRFILNLGVPSPHLGDTADAQDAVDGFFSLNAPNAYPDGTPQVSGYAEARAVLADFVRDAHNKATGVDLSQKSDAEMIDGIGYNIFPNVILWGGYSLLAMHRFRPNGHDHRSCLWEFIGFAPYPEGTKLERDAPLVMLRPDEPFEEKLGFNGYILDQDVRTLTLAQQGMETDGCEGFRFANYQERNLRNFELYLADLVGAS